MAEKYTDLKVQYKLCMFSTPGFRSFDHEQFTWSPQRLSTRGSWRKCHCNCLNDIRGGHLLSRGLCRQFWWTLITNNYVQVLKRTVVDFHKAPREVLQVHFLRVVVVYTIINWNALETCYLVYLEWGCDFLYEIRGLHPGFSTNLFYFRRRHLTLWLCACNFEVKRLLNRLCQV